MDVTSKYILLIVPVNQGNSLVELISSSGWLKCLGGNLSKINYWNVMSLFMLFFSFGSIVCRIYSDCICPAALNVIHFYGLPFKTSRS